MNRITTLSLFSGAGGLDIGFVKAGFNIVASVELQKEFCNTLEANIGKYYTKKHKIICKDISQFNPKEELDTEIDFIIGGPPCQSFSAAGRRAGGVYGINDVRGSLFWEYCRIITELKPKGFLFENVRGILQSNSKKDWDFILKSFSELGYKIKFRVMDAADYGVPQHRERLVIVGNNTKNDYFFPRPTHGPDSVTKINHVSVYEAFKEIDNPGEIVPEYGGKYGELVKAVPPGMNYLFFTENMGHQQPLFAWRSKFSDFLYKVDPSMPSKTLVASQGRYGGPFHWRGRKMTILELKRLQSFPDDYDILGSYNIAAKQIGNSVAPLFAEKLAESVAKTVFKKKIEIETISDDFILTFDNRKSKKAKKTRASNQRKSMNTYGNDLFSDIERDSLKVFHEKRTIKYSSPRKHSANGSYGEYQIECSLSKGLANINVRKTNGTFKILLNLKFDGVVLNAFDEIKCELTTDTSYDYCILWDAINDFIRKTTSYDSIEPLYGHFTEPYPRFSISIKSKIADDPLLHFISEIAIDKNISELKELSKINDIFHLEPIEVIKKLREYGFDIRVNETNRTIPKGFYKVCYPFTIDIHTQKFVAWKEKGKHKTADKSHIPSGDFV